MNKKAPTAFDKLKEKTILKHVRSVIWVMVETNPVVKFVPYYRHTVPHPSLCEEVQRRSIKGVQPRTVYIAKACRSTDGSNYLANPIEISFSKSAFNTPTAPHFDENYTVSDYIKDSFKTIPHNKDHFITDVLIFRCADEEFDEQELFTLLEREGLFKLSTVWEDAKSITQ